MSLPDATHAAALDAEVIKPIWFAYLDFEGDPVRANTSGADITPTGSGDPDLDDLEFTGISASFVDVSSLKVGEGGSDSVTARLSGLKGIDDDTLALINDPANWRGRDARLWRIVRNAANVQQGGFHAYYTGKMTGLHHRGSGEEQMIEVTIESYIDALSEASNRTYLDQENYDPGDKSARATLAIANGNYTGAATRSGGRVGPNYVGPNGQDRMFEQ
jgi:hypothetical protein